MQGECEVRVEGCVGDGSTGARPCWDRGFAVDGTRCEADVICTADLRRIEAYRRAELRTMRTVPRDVLAWGRRRPLASADLAERCDGPTLRESCVTRARAWSDHVRAVVSAYVPPLGAMTSGEC